MSDRKYDRIGFIGLGNMGAPMAANLIRDEFDVSVFDVRPDAMRELVEEGATAANSVAEVAANVDVLCICVLNDRQIRDLFTSETGILRYGRTGLITIIHSTMSPTTGQELALVAAELGITVVDAPVTGASMASIDGTLTVMVGGPQAAVDAVMPILTCVGTDIIYLGEVGKPQAAKLANNIMAVCNEAIVMEAIKFGEAFGLSRDQVLRVASSGTGSSWSATNYDYFENWAAEHPLTPENELPHRMTKDIRSAVAVAQERMVNLPLTALCTQLIPSMFAARWSKQSTTDES